MDWPTQKLGSRIAWLRLRFAWWRIRHRECITITAWDEPACWPGFAGALRSYAEQRGSGCSGPLPPPGR